MPYLTYAEYKTYGFNEVSEEEFNRLLPKASDAIDSVTRYFYSFNNILDDKSSFRREQFKKSVASQIEYFDEMGATTVQGMREPGSVTIGRTSMSTGSRSASKEVVNSLLSDGAITYLAPTGLLYGGVSSC